MFFIFSRSAQNIDRGLARTTSLKWRWFKQEFSAVLSFCSFEPRCEKTDLRGSRPGQTQTRLYNHSRWIEAWNFVYRKQRGCTICVAKTKALISFVVTAKLIYVFVFVYAKSRFSHDEAHVTEASYMYIYIHSSFTSRKIKVNCHTLWLITVNCHKRR